MNVTEIAHERLSKVYLNISLLLSEMSLSKPFTIGRVNDSILGSFAFIQPSETLDHLVRYLGTWSGSELRISLRIKKNRWLNLE